MEELFPIQRDMGNGRKCRLLSGISIVGRSNLTLGVRGSKNFPRQEAPPTTQYAEKVLYELNRNSVEGHKLLIEVSGQTFSHCVYLGWRGLIQSCGRKDFFDRVTGYQTKKSQDKRYKMIVKFYETAS